MKHLSTVETFYMNCTKFILFLFLLLKWQNFTTNVLFRYFRYPKINSAIQCSMYLGLSSSA